MGDEEYQRQSDTKRSARGNRRRLSEWTAAFEAAGFKVAEVQINGVAPEEYFSAFVPRLRGVDTIYRDWPESDLRILGARLCLRR